MIINTADAILSQPFRDCIFLGNPAEFNQARPEGASFNNSHIPCRKVMGLCRRRGR
jgi:hypothetical protein